MLVLQHLHSILQHYQEPSRTVLRHLLGNRELFLRHQCRPMARQHARTHRVLVRLQQCHCSRNCQQEWSYSPSFQGHFLLDTAVFLLGISGLHKSRCHCHCNSNSQLYRDSLHHNHRHSHRDKEPKAGHFYPGCPDEISRDCH